MVPAQEVEEAMTDQPMQFIAQAVIVVLGLSLSRVNRHDDVPEFHCFAFKPVGCVVECSKGQHIGGA